MATLDKLPFDILPELLYASQSVQDLHSLALSSRPLYSAFQEYRFPITLSVLKAELGPANYRQLLAIPNAPKHEELVNSPVGGNWLQHTLTVLRPYLGHYFSAQPFDDPIDLKNMEPIL
ncbi:hypothetical protein V8F33_004949 [Rhypophila sp. PSN 637]